MLLLVRLIAADEWDEMNADAREASTPIMRIRKNTERMWGGRSNHAGRYVQALWSKVQGHQQKMRSISEQILWTESVCCTCTYGTSQLFSIDRASFEVQLAAEGQP